MAPTRASSAAKTSSGTGGGCLGPGVEVEAVAPEFADCSTSVLLSPIWLTPALLASACLIPW